MNTDRLIAKELVIMTKIYRERNCPTFPVSLNANGGIRYLLNEKFRQKMGISEISGKLQILILKFPPLKFLHSVICQCTRCLKGKNP